MDELPYSQRKGIICQIHKGKSLSRDDLSNWRPISLTNVDYKILAKLLAIRLNTVIDSLVDKDQKGFIRGRSAAQLLREIDDIIENNMNAKTTGILLSIDYRKAFDSISTKFLGNVFGHFGFGNYFQRWIRIILKGRINCVKNGGHISEDFEMQRGIRQGCPVSPMIFVLAVEIMANYIRSDIHISGIKIKHSKNVIKQYADDTTLFLKDKTEFKRAIDKLNVFAAVSGLQLNNDKSSFMVLGGNICWGEKEFEIKRVEEL